MARALAGLLVTLAFLAGAWFLTVLPPAIWVACALACYVIALAIRVTCAFAFAVGTPELSRTLYRERQMFELCKTNGPYLHNILSLSHVGHSNSATTWLTSCFFILQNYSRYNFYTFYTKWTDLCTLLNAF